MSSNPRLLLARIKSEVEALEAEIVRSEAGEPGAEPMSELIAQARQILTQLEEIRAVRRQGWSNMLSEGVPAAREAAVRRVRRSMGENVAVESVEYGPDAEGGPGGKSPAYRRGTAAGTGSDEAASSGKAQMQKRELIVDVLGRLGWPSPPATVSTVIKFLYATEVLPSQFASMRKGDERTWHKGRRDRAIILPALNSFDLCARPRTVALSTWPIERRIMGSLSDRADALRAILAARNWWVNEGGTGWRDLLFALARDFRFAPPNAEGNDVEAMLVVERARESLAEIKDKDLEERAAAAERALRLPEDQQLFGRPVGFHVFQGGRHE